MQQVFINRQEAPASSTISILMFLHTPASNIPFKNLPSNITSIIVCTCINIPIKIEVIFYNKKQGQPHRPMATFN